MKETEKAFCLPLRADQSEFRCLNIVDFELEIIHLKELNAKQYLSGVV